MSEQEGDGQRRDNERAAVHLVVGMHRVRELPAVLIEFAVSFLIHLVTHML